MKTTENFVVITEGMVRTNAIFALLCGTSTKKVRNYLKENKLQLVAWENVNGRNYMAVEPITDLIGIEFEPEKVDRNLFEKILHSGTVTEI
jgi:hypothetical protein